jgi:hypothetical protein
MKLEILYKSNTKIFLLYLISLRMEVPLISLKHLCTFLLKFPLIIEKKITYMFQVTMLKRKTNPISKFQWLNAKLKI